MSKYKELLADLDANTLKHSENVGILLADSARYLGMDASLAYQIGLFHDIGKRYIPASLLNSNKKLTALERAIIDPHAYYGYFLLKDDGFKREVYMPVLFHHGFNKPKVFPVNERITENELKYTRLLIAADIFDATMHRRPYHTKDFSFEDVIKILRDNPLIDDDSINAILFSAKTEWYPNVYSKELFFGFDHQKTLISPQEHNYTSSNEAIHFTQKIISA